MSFYTFDNSNDNLPPTCSDGNIKPYVQWLQKQDTAFFNTCVEQNTILSLKYSVLCAGLLKGFTAGEVARELIEEALAQAVKLDYLFHHYLGLSPRSSDIVNLEEDILVYQSLLSGINLTKRTETPPTAPTKPPESEALLSLHPIFQWARPLLEWPHFLLLELGILDLLNKSTKWIRAITAKTNPPRLLGARFRKFLDLVDALSGNSAFHLIVRDLNVILKPVFNWLSWLFYAPRLTVNLVLFAKHLIPTDHMTLKEKDLSTWSRLIGQSYRRLAELANDLPWFIGGFLTCFILVGSFAPAGIYVNVALYFYDVVVASVRAGIDFKNMCVLRQDEQKSGKLTDQMYLAMEERFAFDRKRLLLSISNTGLLAILICVTLPCIFASPALITSCFFLIVMVTAIAYGLQLYLERTKPADGFAAAAKKAFESFAKDPCTCTVKPNLANLRFFKVERVPSDFNVLDLSQQLLTIKAITP